MNIDTINPSIISPQEELEEIIREYITPDKLRKITGIKNLDEARSIELKVDSRKTSIGNVGKILPNLSQLNLNNSYFDSIRNLGSSFENLNILWACNCSIKELDGISSFNSLKKLYVNKNLISDLYSITMLENLETLNIESNLVSDIEQLEYLALCPSLKNLTIRNNPIMLKLKITIEKNEKIIKQNKIHAYNKIIKNLIPSISILDGVLIESKKINILTDEEINDILKKAEEMQIETTPINKTTTNKYYGIENEVEEASELTYGTSETVCGNPALFLRSRRQEKQELCHSIDKPQLDVEIKNYIENLEKEDDFTSNLTEDNNLIDENEISNKDHNNDNISTKTQQKLISDKEKKKKIKHKTIKKVPNIDEEKKCIEFESESLTENCDMISNIIIKDKTEISNKSEKLIKKKIKKTIIDEYDMKKASGIKHQRSKSSITSSPRTNTLTTNSSGYHKVPTKAINNKPFVSIDSIYSISSSDSSSTCGLKKEPISKPHMLHRRSSTTESGLDLHKYASPSPPPDKKSPLSPDIFLALKNNSIINSKSLSKKLNKFDTLIQKKSDITDLEKQNKRNIYVRKLNIKSHTFNTSRDFNDLTFINNKMDNNLIPHPPLKPITSQEDEHRPISVPIIRRRMYKKK